MSKEPSEGASLRKIKKEATRKRLLAAALEILLDEGVAGLTTGKIAQGANIAQSGFYVHFENIDACLAALGAEIGGTLVELEAGLRRQRLRKLSPENSPEEVLRDTTDRMRIVLSHCVARRRESALLLRCRLDPTPLGESIRNAVRRAERLLVQDLWDVAAGLGLRGSCLPEIELLGAMLVSSFLGALELCVLNDTYDVDTVAPALARSQYHFAHAELTRLKSEQAQRDREASAE
jgi:AcrR family transcriptional regulator